MSFIFSSIIFLLSQNNEIFLINKALNTPLSQSIINFCEDIESDDSYFQCEQDSFELIEMREGWFSAIKQRWLLDKALSTKTWIRFNQCFTLSEDPENCFCGEGYYFCGDNSVSCCPGE